MIVKRARHDDLIDVLSRSVATQSAAIPTKIQQLFYDAGSMGGLLQTATLRGQIARFLHKHNHPTTVWRRRKNLYCFSAIWNLEQAQASGNPAACYPPRLGDDGMMTSKISRIIAPVILLFSGPALAQPDTRRGFESRTRTLCIRFFCPRFPALLPCPTRGG
jgi:hypothetical protein